MQTNLKKFLTKTEQNYRSFVWFVAKLIFWVFVLVWLTPLFASAFIGRFKPNNVSVNDFILFVTAAFIIAYTYETQKMKEQAVKQTELEQMPVMVLYIRNIRDYMIQPADYYEQERLKNKYRDYLIRIRTEENSSDYFLSLRNTGKGTVFNVRVESDIFEVIKYKSQFFAPLKDEHSIAIIKKGDKKIESWGELNGAIFKIYCSNVVGQSYCFKYKIVDIKNQKVEFVGTK